jgi:hypothetical protein
MTYRPACEAAVARTTYNLTAHPAWRLEDPDRGIKCGACGERHATTQSVQSCHAEAYYEAAQYYHESCGESDGYDAYLERQAEHYRDGF